MGYQCRACSYKGKTFPGGACPACGSMQIVRLKKRDPLEDHARPPYRLALAIAMWIYLAYSLWQKLF